MNGLPMWQQNTPQQPTLGIMLNTPTALSVLGIINVVNYGNNVGSGGDDSAAFVAAMAVVNASPHQVLYIPPGSYTYNQTVNGSLTFTQQQSGMIGAGRASSEITFTGTSGVGVVMSAANGYQSISGVFLYSATSTTSSLVSWTAGSYGAVYDAVLYTSGSAALSVTQNSAIDFALDNVILAITGATSVGLTCQPGPSQIRATNFLIIGTNLSGQTGILFPSATSLDTGTFSAFMIAGVGTGIAMLPGSGGVCGDLYFSDAFVANTIQALYMNPTSPGTIQRASFDNVWFDSGIASSGNQVVNIAGSGSIYDVSFNHCRMVGAVTAGFIGVYIHNTATPLVRITDCMVEIQSSYGIYVGNDCKLQINGGRIAQCGYALAFNSATGWTNNKSVFGLDVSDTTNTAPLLLTTAANTYGPYLTLRSCPGINAYGALTPPGVPANNTYTQNVFPFDTTVYVTAGVLGLTVTLSNVGSGGVTAFALAAAAVGTFALPAGSWYAYTYTNPPTHQWVAS